MKLSAKEKRELDKVINEAENIIEFGSKSELPFKGFQLKVALAQLRVNGYCGMVVDGKKTLYFEPLV